MLVNPAAHVDLWIRKQRGSTTSTIAWTTLRVDHRIHKPATTTSLAGQRPRQEFGRSSLFSFKSPKNGSLLSFR